MRAARERLRHEVKEEQEQKCRDQKSTIRHLWWKESSFKHRELSESEATLPVQGTGTSQQILPLPDQRGIQVTPGLCTITA